VHRYRGVVIAKVRSFGLQDADAHDVLICIQTGTTVGAPTGGGTGGFGFFGSAAPSGTIQEPELQITEVKTTVSVPDGGTLLLGGQTLAGETEREIGVPVLSKIPFLKRLFTSRSLAKDEQVLLIGQPLQRAAEHRVEARVAEPVDLSARVAERPGTNGTRLPLCFYANSLQSLF